MAKQYELTYTVSKNLMPEEASSLFEKILCYFPQATGTSKGYDFFTLEFYSEPAMIQDFEKKLKSESQIKKYLLVKKETFKAMRTRTRKIPEETLTSEKKVEKIELKEIDKKLKEIFGE